MPAAPALLAELLPSWQVALTAQHKSRHTIAQYTDGVRMFLRWCESGGKSPSATMSALVFQSNT